MKITEDRKISIVVAIYFAMAMSLFALLSCKSKKDANCDAYGKVEKHANP